MKAKSQNVSDKAIEQSVKNITWDLSELYKSADDKKIKTDIAAGIKAAEEFQKKYSGKMNKITKPADFAKMFAEYERCLEIVNKFMQFAFLNLSLDTSCAKAKSLMSFAEEKCADLENKLLFFRLELCEIS
ncbi:MAG TPA: hypothetical protein PKL57_10785 [Candidatus Wallbacteria bacterium]|nr:hypothetical protein [Candidatus Wallbacteria bacterium]